MSPRSLGLRNEPGLIPIPPAEGFLEAFCMWDLEGHMVMVISIHK